MAEGHGGFARNPHDAVPFFVATAVVLTLMACARFAHALRRAPGRAGGALPSLRTVWLSSAGGLVAIHLLQETLEGGVEQALAPATLVAVALAVVVGLAIALALRTAERLIVARAAGRPSLPRAAAAIRPRAPRRLGIRCAPLARHLAGRAPPRAA
ncbi:MAG: hypothetical protein QOH13_24 [Thermoleophilaceae bacterium]|nr:hypothetical protein [Thermoleophilaceae bacterium]